jgi:RNA polymerase sigma-70 factor (ECF subfamily)
MLLQQRQLRCDEAVGDRFDTRRSGMLTTDYAFRKNVEATIPALRRYARALTRNVDIADCLVQQTLARALRSEHQFNGSDVRIWLYKILIDLNRNRLRWMSQLSPLSLLEDNDALDLTGPKVNGRDIECALAALVEDQRSTLLLVVLEGLTYREVADVQDVPVGTVISRLARARARIKNYLDIDGPRFGESEPHIPYGQKIESVEKTVSYPFPA